MSTPGMRDVEHGQVIVAGVLALICPWIIKAVYLAAAFYILWKNRSAIVPEVHPNHTAYVGEES